MKIQVNDIVTVRTDLVVGKSYGIFVFGKSEVPTLGKQFKVARSIWNSKCLYLKPIEDKIIGLSYFQERELRVALSYPFTPEMLELNHSSKILI